MLSMHVGLPATNYPQAGEEAVTVTIMGSRDSKPDEPYTCSDDNFLPATGFLHPLQLTVQYSCQFLNFPVKFQWFKCELFSIKKFG